jgi:hypothetical protein
VKAEPSSEPNVSSPGSIANRSTLPVNGFVDSLAVLSGEVDELSGSCDDGASVWGAGDGDASAAAEFE